MGLCRTRDDDAVGVDIEVNLRAGHDFELLGQVRWTGAPSRSMNTLDQPFKPPISCELRDSELLRGGSRTGLRLIAPRHHEQVSEHCRRKRAVQAHSGGGDMSQSGPFELDSQLSLPRTGRLPQSVPPVRGFDR
jgi:hypothetical protein